MTNPDVEDQIITTIEVQPRQPHRYNIYINDQFAFSVHEDIVVKFRLLKGAPMTDRIRQEILTEEERNAAYRTAIRYIGRSMKTAEEVRGKLAMKGYSQEIISGVVQRMIEERLVDDELYANALARQRLRSNKKGPLWIKRELMQKGVDKLKVELALTQFDQTDEKEQAWELVSRRWSQTKGEAADRIRKLAALLQRRGFTSETIRSVMQRLRESDHNTDENNGDDLEYLNGLEE